MVEGEMFDFASVFEMEMMMVDGEMLDFAAVL